MYGNFWLLTIRKRCSSTGQSLATAGGGGYSHILAIRVCAAGKGLVFKPFSLV